MKVSVIIANRDNATLLPRAIKSVHNQKTNFPFEIVIVDDGSVDGSVKAICDVVTSLNKKDRIYSIQSHEHIGMNPTYAKAILSSTGDFIAFCDSDDYWIDMNKLQMQYDFMSAHPEFKICYTNMVTIRDCNNCTSACHSPLVWHEITYNELLRGACIPSPTVMASGGITRVFVSTYEYKKFYYWDYPLYLYLSYCGRIHHIQHETAVFNRQEESFTQTRKRLKRFKYIWGTMEIKFWFLHTFGGNKTTLLYIIYRFIRDIYSLIFKRWYK